MPLALIGRLSSAVTARPIYRESEDMHSQTDNRRPTCAIVETEIFVSPSPKKVAWRFRKSIPNDSGIARVYSYQKPVTMEM